MAKDKEAKDNKDKKALVGRVRKVVKKSRRKLGEEKFEKELQRTISFLTELRERLKAAPAGHGKTVKPSGNGKAKPAPKAPAKAPVKSSAAAPVKASVKTKAKAPAKAAK